MCDTLCALESQSKENAVLFAKNSDRSPNEPHLVVRKPDADYPVGTGVKLTYITVPQAAHTFTTILCKPSWTWGAEMGVNEYSVAVGNEAVFTKTRRGEAALTGMDLVRLALERAENAKEAVSCITSLLERYGQGGNCGFDHEFHYDNSFLIADPQEGYILETAGRKWVAVKIEKSAAISNRLSIHTEHTQRGGVEDDFDFAGKLMDPVYTYFSGSKQRREAALSALRKPVCAADMMAALRQHNVRDEGHLFRKGSVRSVCMHAGGIIGDHTAGSLVAVLREGKPSTLWITGASTPCIAAFKPAVLGIHSGVPVFAKEENAKQYWLQREKLHRAVLADAVNVSALRKQRDMLEKKWLETERALIEMETVDEKALSVFVKEAAAEEQAMIDMFIPAAIPPMHGRGRYGRYWTKKNTALEKG